MSLPKRIIKSSRRGSKSVLVDAYSERSNAPLNAANEEEQVLQRAQVEAAGHIEVARKEAEEIRAAAEQEGYRKGIDAAQAEIKKALQEIRNLALEARMDRESILRDCERQAVELALAVARKVVYRELTSDPSLVTAAVEEAMARIKTADWVRLRVCPNDLALVSAYWEELSVSDPNADRITLVADSEVQQGGCLIDTVAGVMDTQPDTKLLEIEQGFTEVWGK